VNRPEAFRRSPIVRRVCDTAGILATPKSAADASSAAASRFLCGAEVSTHSGHLCEFAAAVRPSGWSNRQHIEQQRIACGRCHLQQFGSARFQPRSSRQRPIRRVGEPTQPHAAWQGGALAGESSQPRARERGQRRNPSQQRGLRGGVCCRGH
jgi:hypothetical protein